MQDKAGEGKKKTVDAKEAEEEKRSGKNNEDFKKSAKEQGDAHTEEILHSAQCKGGRVGDAKLSDGDKAGY